MRRVAAILNPRADRGRTAQFAESLRRAVASRLEVTLLETTCRGHAIELARDAVAAGNEAVIAIGGDGTVHEIANGLMATPPGERPALGILPAGSGNDVAFALGITADLPRTIEAIERGATRPVDVGRIETDAGRASYFLNNVGALLEGQINLASHKFTWPRGPGLYLRALAVTLMHRPPVAQLELDVDGVSQVRKAILLSIANGPRSGGKFQLTPTARIDDGRFDYLVAGPMHRLRLLLEVSKTLRGQRADSPWIERGQFSTMTIRANIPLPVHVDGEPWLTPDENVCQLTITMQPHALRVICSSHAS
jgi:YegS/Rv2252/BmrU family lipid kinase